VRPDSKAPIDYTLRVTPSLPSQQPRSANARANPEVASAFLKIAAPVVSPCGEIAWWRNMDVQGLLERHGQVEHLIVQMDFMGQLALEPRAEFSIPASAKSGNTGYADVVALKDRQIWEIKPEHLEPDAVVKATRYVACANVACGPGWVLGTGYQPSRSPLVDLQGTQSAKLFARQGQAGAILYWWEIDGQKVKTLTPQVAPYLRQAVVDQVFGRLVAPTTIPGAQPTDVPPVKWTPLYFTPSLLVPELQSLATLFTDDFQLAGQSVFYPDTWSALLLVEKAAYDRLVGPRLVAQRIAMLQPQSNPYQQLERDAYTAIQFAFAAGMIAAIAFSTGMGVAVPGTAMAAVAVAAEVEGATVGGVFVTELVTALRAAVAPVAAPVFRAVTQGGSAVLMLPATQIAFGLPEAQAATPTTLDRIDRKRVLYSTRNPDELGSFHVGQIMQDANGDEWVVAGIART
jgi:hypothetical protein